ncbi:putative polysaccharide deacetylase PdaA precursor [Clostridium sp. N3C]|uniref:polysaccharide deacetylase family protein n=1 Tax=Clostridium sp. N3C TaxID=1776758 RepID=UPI00092E02F9|nr:polysaccharide deacetylase family protein [Clostridium sp. N3C]SCN21431.1 putative polysaccharide deacetylase PdaA precursor [Clostridium sp. N3C]
MIIIIKKEKLKKTFTKGALLLVALIAIFTMTVDSKGVFVSKKRKLPIYSVDTKEKKIAITFDASWPKDNTDEIIEILDKYNVKATFFLVGTWVDHNPEKLKILHEKGHEIGNHTNTHPDMNSISRSELLKEIEALDSKIKKITGQGTTLFRCPSGVYNDLIIETVESTNRYCIQWDVDSIDWKAQGEEIEFNRVVKKTKPGSIILFHNDGRYTTKTLPRIIEYFKKEGYSMVTVSELIYKSDFMIDHNGKQIYNK